MASCRSSAAGADLACPLCGSHATAAFDTSDRNRGLSNASFSYRRCRGCSTYFLADVPGDLGRYYPSDYHHLPPPDELRRAVRAEAPKLDLLRPFAAGGRLIDVGAGLGTFARAARATGFDVTAIEMDADCCAHLERVVGVQAVRSDAPHEALRGLEPARAITLWHVLEHLPEPMATLEQAAARLEPGGVLAIATPNPEALQFRLLRGRWAHVDAPRHLFLIPLDALARRLDALGLTVVRTTTTDRAGRHWNRFGWEHALRRSPARRPSTRGTRALALAIAWALAPVEQRGLNGTAYTALFVKRDGGSKSTDRERSR